MGLVLTKEQRKSFLGYDEPAAKSTQSVTSSQPAAQPTAKPAVKEWDKTYQPFIEDNKLQKYINYDNSKHIMRAINGKYDKNLSVIKNEDPELYKQFQKFITASKVAGQSLLDAPNKGNFDEFKKNRDTANVLYTDLANKLNYDNKDKKKWAIDKEANLWSRKDYEKHDNEPHASEGSSTNARAIFSGTALKAYYETSGTSAEFEKLGSVTSDWQNRIKAKTVPIVSSWVTNTVQNIDPKNTTKAKNNNEAWNLNVDLLKHVSEFGTIAGKDVSESDKKEAMAIRKQMWNKDLAGQLNVLKNNADALSGFSKRLGFYGSTKLLKAHKDTVGTVVKFYPNSSEKTNDQYANFDMDDIDEMLKTYHVFKKEDKSIRNNALAGVKNNWDAVKNASGMEFDKKQFDLAADAMVDGNGNILSFDKWKKTLRGQVDPSGNNVTYNDPTEFSFQAENKLDAKGNRIKQNALGQIWEQNKTANWDDLAGYFTGNTNKEGVREDLYDVYKNLKTSYKKQFADVKYEVLNKSTGIKNGFGDNWNKPLSYYGVDLSVDKDYNLKAATSPKQENVNKVLSLIKDKNGDILKKDVTIFNNDDVKEGLHAIQKGDLKGYQTKNADNVKDYFKGDMSHVTMEFFRNTNIPGQVAYSFYNTNNKKSMVIYAPEEKVAKDTGVNENLYSNTGKSVYDFSFQLKGDKKMKVYQVDNKPAYQEAKLIYDADKGTYVGKMKYFNEDGNLTDHDFIIPYAQAITVRGATDAFNSFLLQYAKSKN